MFIITYVSERNVIVMPISEICKQRMTNPNVDNELWLNLYEKVYCCVYIITCFLSYLRIFFVFENNILMLLPTNA